MAKAKEEKNYHEGHRGRMRQRFDNDPEMMTFQEHEMLEYILNATIPRGDTNGIAHALIAEHGSLYGVFNAPVEDLVAAKGMTVSAAYLIAGIIPIIRKATQKYCLWFSFSFRKILAPKTVKMQYDVTIGAVNTGF